MNNLLSNLKTDIRLMLDLSREIGMLNEKLLKHNETTNKKYYDSELCDKIITKVNEKHDLLFDLKRKWLGEE